MPRRWLIFAVNGHGHVERTRRNPYDVISPLKQSFDADNSPFRRSDHPGKPREIPVYPPIEIPRQCSF